jgi:hypothetical protein
MPQGLASSFHGILADPQLKGKTVNPLDGEKLLVEFCLAVLVVTTAWAWHYRVRKDRQERARGIGRIVCLKALRTINENTVALCRGSVRSL